MSTFGRVPSSLKVEVCLFLAATHMKVLQRRLVAAVGSVWRCTTGYVVGSVAAIPPLNATGRHQAGSVWFKQRVGAKPL